MYSAILRPLGSEHALLPLAVPLAVCEAVEALASLECRVKWPNDVWIEERRSPGVLLEARPPDWAVIGIGLNLAVEPAEFPPDLRWPATSVGQGVTAAAALAALNESLGLWVDASPERVLEEFEARDALRGREIRWEGAGADSPSGAGRAEGIDERGNLLVATDDGRRLSLGAGEVSPVASPGRARALAAAAARANHRDRERQRHQQHPGQVDRRAPGDPAVPDLERPRGPHQAAEADADAACSAAQPRRLFDGCSAATATPAADHGRGGDHGDAVSLHGLAEDLTDAQGLANALDQLARVHGNRVSSARRRFLRAEGGGPLRVWRRHGDGAALRSRVSSPR